MTRTATSARDSAAARAASSSARRPGPTATLPRRRMPAVSMSTTSLRPQARRVSMASRVVPGMSTDDRPLLAEQRVEQARLADVRPPDERDRRRAPVGLGGHRGVPARRPRRSLGGRGSAASPRRRRRRPPRASPTTNGSRRPAATSSAHASASRLARLAGELLLASRAAAPRRSRRAGRRCRGRAVAEIGVGLVPAEGVELGALELALLVVGLVDGDDDRRRARAAAARRPPRRRRSCRSRRRRRRR